MQKRNLISRLKKYSSAEEWRILYLTFHDICSIIFFVIFHKSLIKEVRQKNKKPIWLFCERGNDAKDNGFILFKYVRERHSEINAYYVISEESKGTIDYEKVQEVGNLIHHKSFEHKLYFILADVLIDTHLIGWIVPWNIGAYSKLQCFDIFKKPFIFLQHGVIKDDLSDKLGAVKNNFSIFITGAQPEHDYILKNFGFDESVVKYTGLARFDCLYDFILKDQILLMPTWRQYIMQPSFEKKQVVSDADFLKTQYYKTYQSLINSEALNKFLTKNNKKIIFYPHFEAQRYLKYFTTKSKNIIIADKDHYDVQELLKESKLLITDYSSVFFDFAYMKKPMIFYQFDEEEFFTKHYKKGYFEYRNDAFGPVVTEEKELLQNIKSMVHANFMMEETHKKRVNKFFPLHDMNNCKRIVEVVKNVSK